MHQTMQNPPGAAYVIALASAIVGRSEAALHAVSFAIAGAAVVGTYQLARLLSPRPLLAAVLTLLAPAFLVLAGMVRSDLLMLALWIWTIYFWIRGTCANRRADLWLSAGLMSAGMLTKYFAISLLPLLLADLLIRRPRKWSHALPLLVPLVVLAAYHALTLRLYGHSLLTEAAAYAQQHGRRMQWLNGLTLLGGCGASILLYLLAARWRTLPAMFAGGACLIAAALYAWNARLPYPIVIAGTVDGAFLLQWALWLCAGTTLLAFGLSEIVRHRREPDTVLLGLWIVGTAGFGIAINWTANSRSLLPVVPALAILASRARVDWQPKRERLLWAAVLPAAALGLVYLWADASSANADRALAHAVHAAVRVEHRDVRFAGHWGFQYYMQQAGYRPIDYSLLDLDPGTLIILPRGNTNVEPLPEGVARMEGSIEAPTRSPGIVVNGQLHAGFHSDVFGPLPIAFGEVPPQQCFVQRVLKPIHGLSLLDLYQSPAAK
jgi:4-amino-4-deoxy-L-arabinose transferase-like glycosyltransferase